MDEEGNDEPADMGRLQHGWAPKESGHNSRKLEDAAGDAAEDAVADAVANERTYEEAGSNQHHTKGIKEKASAAIAIR